MPDILTTWNPHELYGDWLVDPPALAEGADLETSVLISLFTDARAADDDRLPTAQDDRRGWWARPVGSRLWLLAREVATNEVRLRAQDYCREALEWMIEDGVADEIEVAADYTAPPDQRRLEVEVAIYRSGNLIFTRRWGWAWAQQRQRAIGSTGSKET